MKNYYLKVKSTGVKSSISINGINVAATNKKSSVSFNMPINEYILQGENMVKTSIVDKSGEESMTYDISICSVIGAPNPENEMELIITISDFNTPIKIIPFVATNSVINDMLSGTTIIDLTDIEEMKSFLTFIKSIYIQFDNEDFDVISNLFSEQFKNYETAYGLDNGSRKSEFLSSLKSISSSCNLIAFKPEKITPKIHALGKIIEPYYEDNNLAMITYYNDTLTHEIHIKVAKKEGGKFYIIR